MKIRAIELFIRERLLMPFVGRLFKRERVSKEYFLSFSPEKILVSKIHHKIGDLLVETPVITNLRHRFPSSKIDFISSDYNFPAIYNNKYLNKTYRFKKSLRLSFIVHNLNLLRVLRKERYDLGIVLSATAFSATNAMLVCLVNPKIIMGLRKPKQTLSIPQMLYNYGVPWPDGIHHRTQISLRTINPIVPEPAFKDETIHFSYLEISEAKKLLMTEGDKTFVGIHAGGTRDNKIWKHDNYKALTGMLSKNDKLQLVIFAGMPDEEKIIHKIIAGLDQKPIIIGPFKHPSYKTFRTMIACISNLDLFIGNDTGTLHAAGATGVPTIGIYTGSNPSRWKPLNRNVHALWNPEVEDVKTAIYSLLENKLHPQGKEINKHGNSASVSAPAFSAID